MFSRAPHPSELTDLKIDTLGTPGVESKLYDVECKYKPDDAYISCYSASEDIKQCKDEDYELPVFEAAGPRAKLFFEPSETTLAIVTCGGLCPGLNDVIRSITLSALWQYGVKRVIGFRYGYKGLSANPDHPPIELTPDSVNEIHHQGGTILGSSRGPQTADEMISTLQKHNVNALFVIGGDGTLSGGYELATEILKRNLKISVIGIPKTIDNDIYCSESTFGYATAVEEARRSIYAAHSEAKAAENGIGLVKLMGRDSGFIAAGATLANSDVNFCLVPEVPFALYGKGGFLDMLELRMDRKKHAVIVVAEGAGQYLFEDEDFTKDASGNVLHKDIGHLLKMKISEHFKSRNKKTAIKYIDPSYTIRSCPANAQDSSFCLLLGKNAVHAAMAGKTNMFIGHWNQEFTHVPLKMTFRKRKKLDPNKQVLRAILATTERMTNFSR